MGTNVALSWPNRTDLATLSAGSWVGTTLDNIKNPVYSSKARSVNATAASSTVRFAYTTPYSIGCMAVLAHNLSPTATIQYTLYQSGTFTTILHQATVNAYPGGITTADLPDIPRNHLYFLPSNLTGQSAQIVITDTTNPAGYIEIGRVFMGSVWEPTINASWGLAYSHEIDSRTDFALDGTAYVLRKRPRRTVVFNLDALTDAESVQNYLALQRVQGLDKEVLYAQSMTDTNLFYRGFVGRLQQPDPISTPFLNRWEGLISLVEII